MRRPRLAMTLLLAATASRAGEPVVTDAMRKALDGMAPGFATWKMDI